MFRTDPSVCAVGAQGRAHGSGTAERSESRSAGAGRGQPCDQAPLEPAASGLLGARPAQSPCHLAHQTGPSRGWQEGVEDLVLPVTDGASKQMYF